MLINYLASGRRSTTLRSVYVMANPSVRLSVCLSVLTSVHCGHKVYALCSFGPRPRCEVKLEIGRSKQSKVKQIHGRRQTVLENGCLVLHNSLYFASDFVNHTTHAPVQ